MIEIMLGLKMVIRRKLNKKDWLRTGQGIVV